MKVMVLTPYLPHRNVGHGGGTAVRDLVTWLARRHELGVISLVRPGEEDLVGDVAALGARLFPIPFLDRSAGGAARAALYAGRAGSWARSLLSGYPLYVQKYWSGAVARRIAACVAEFRPEAVQIEYLQMSLHCRDLAAARRGGAGAGPRLILNSHELGSLPRQRRAERATDPWTRLVSRAEAARWRRLQVAATGWADATLCVTPEDRELYAAMGGRNLVTVPLGMDTTALAADWAPAAPERHLFVGSFGHRPNVLAAEFLVDAVWPRVRADRPAARLVIAGRGSQEFLAGHGPAERWQREGVTALGFVEDLTPLFRECRLFVAPIPEGGGIKIKILEAMARGVPVVTTPVGAEGITGDPGILGIASCDETFATAVLAAAGDEDACRRRAAAARTLIEESFSWEAIVERLTRIYRGNVA